MGYVINLALALVSASMVVLFGYIGYKVIRLIKCSNPVIIGTILFLTL